MTYFNNKDEPTRGWEEPYYQDMSISQHYSSSWENPYYAQDDYEMAHIMSISEYFESREAYNAYTTNEDKWQPTHCPNCFSSTHSLHDCPYLQDMMQPTPCYLFQSYEHLRTNCPMRERFESYVSLYEPKSNISYGHTSTLPQLTIAYTTQ